MFCTPFVPNAEGHTTNSTRYFNLPRIISSSLPSPCTRGEGLGVGGNEVKHSVAEIVKTSDRQGGMVQSLGCVILLPKQPPHPQPFSPGVPREKGARFMMVIAQLKHGAPISRYASPTINLVCCLTLSGSNNCSQSGLNICLLPNSEITSAPSLKGNGANPKAMPISTLICPNIKYSAASRGTPRHTAS